MDNEARREADWRALHDRITEELDRYGKKDAFGRGDYWLVDDDWGHYAHQLEFQNLNLFRPPVIKALQKLLSGFSDWRIFIRVDAVGKETKWPGMGLVVYDDEIIDELQREYLPPEVREFTYEGGHPGKRVDPDDKRYIFRRALK